MTIYGTPTGAIVAGTTTLRITIPYFTNATTGTAFFTGVYDYDLRDSGVTDDYIEEDIRRQAAIVADGLDRWTTISARLNAVAGQRIALT